MAKRNLKDAIIEAVHRYDDNEKDRPEYFTGSRIDTTPAFSVSATKNNGWFDVQVAFYRDNDMTIMLSADNYSEEADNETREEIEEIKKLTPKGIKSIGDMADLMISERWVK